MNKKLEEVITERDIISTQLVKKNDELLAQDTKIKLLQLLLDTRDKQYEQRVDDIRLLKLEIKKLKQEKALLAKGVENMTDLRLEVFNLERELNRERLRSRALEEAIETPQNIHRWRKLEDTDPSTLELLDKIHMLQKQSLKKSQKMMELKTLQQEKTKKQSMLDEIHEKEEINKLKKKLITKEDKLKAVTAELKMREAQIEEFKQNKPNTNSRASSNQKSFRKFHVETRSKSAPQNIKEFTQSTPVKVLGGGFKLSQKKER